MLVPGLVGLVGLGPSPHAKDVEIAVLRLWGSRTRTRFVSWYFVAIANPATWST
jgi:hypothetical protein